MLFRSEKLSGYSSRVKPFEAPRPVAIACFYITVFLFFEMAWDYCSEMLAPSMGERPSPRYIYLSVDPSCTGVSVAGCGGQDRSGGLRAPWLVVEDHHHISVEEK